MSFILSITPFSIYISQYKISVLLYLLTNYEIAFCVLRIRWLAALKTQLLKKTIVFKGQQI